MKFSFFNAPSSDHRNDAYPLVLVLLASWAFPAPPGGHERRPQREPFEAPWTPRGPAEAGHVPASDPGQGGRRGAGGSWGGDGLAGEVLERGFLKEDDKMGTCEQGWKAFKEGATWAWFWSICRLQSTYSRKTMSTLGDGSTIDQSFLDFVSS